MVGTNGLKLWMLKSQMAFGLCLGKEADIEPYLVALKVVGKNFVGAVDKRF